MNIDRGYEPVTKLDTNVMTSRSMLASLNFPDWEIDKLEIGLKARKLWLKSIKREFHPNLFSRLFKKGKGEPEPLFCDICSKSVYVTPEFVPPLPLPIPHGAVIDYNRGKVYLVCGTCQLKLGLEATEAGLPIHEIKEGYGYVDLDRLRR